MSATRLTSILNEVKASVAKDLPNCTIGNTSHNDWPGGKVISLSNKAKFSETLTFELFEMPTCCAILVQALLHWDIQDALAVKVMKALEKASINQRYTQIVYNEANGSQDKVLNDSGYKCRKPFKSIRTGSIIRTWLKMLG